MSRSEVATAVAEVLAGNREAFRQIVETYRLSLRSYLASHIYRLDDVDDLAQEVFISAYRALGRYRPDEDFGAWLRGIARNALLMHFRTSARRDSAVERFRAEVARAVESDLDRAAADDRTEVIERLLRCVAQLPERMRRVVRAGLDGNKPAALAAEMETTPTTVYNLHYRANRLLRECLQRGVG
ncbi:MAG TPA: sigma-70 family RNA polymerase sigma factor [Gemmata sp.]